MVRQKSLNIMPAMPPVRPRGKKTATVVSVEATTEVVTSLVPSTQALSRSCPSAAEAVDIFQHHDGVIHDHAHAHGDAAQAHHVQRQVKHVHQDEHRQNAHRHGDRDGHGGAPAAQEQKDHHSGQHHAQDDILQGGLHRPG